jgi:catalase
MGRKGSPNQTAIGFAVIGVLVTAIVGSFAYVAGWLSPGLLTPERFVDGFEEVSGVHPGFRRNHAKGVCVAGYFDSNGNGAKLSKAVVFERGRVPIIGRPAAIPRWPTHQVRYVVLESLSGRPAARNGEQRPSISRSSWSTIRKRSMINC